MKYQLLENGLSPQFAVKEQRDHQQWIERYLQWDH
jgi:hypothetical protein